MSSVATIAEESTAAGSSAPPLGSPLCSVQSVSFPEILNQLGSSLLVSTYQAGKPVAAFQFVDGVEKFFDLRVLPSIRCPVLRGPFPKDDNTDEISVAPRPASSPTPPTT